MRVCGSNGNSSGAHESHAHKSIWNYHQFASQHSKSIEKIFTFARARMRERTHNKFKVSSWTFRMSVKTVFWIFARAKCAQLKKMRSMIAFLSSSSFSWSKLNFCYLQIEWNSSKAKVEILHSIQDFSSFIPRITKSNEKIFTLSRVTSRENRTKVDEKILSFGFQNHRVFFSSLCAFSWCYMMHWHRFSVCIRIRELTHVQGAHSKRSHFSA